MHSCIVSSDTNTLKQLNTSCALTEMIVAMVGFLIMASLL